MRAGISSDNNSRKNSAIYGAFRVFDLGRDPSLATGFGEVANTRDIGLALGHRDDATGVKKVEEVACLHALIVGWQRQRPALRLTVP